MLQVQVLIFNRNGFGDGWKLEEEEVMGQTEQSARLVEDNADAANEEEEETSPQPIEEQEENQKNYKKRFHNKCSC